MGNLRWLAAVAAMAVAACGFNLTAPFEGFDGEGSRISGSFESSSAAQSVGYRAASRGPSDLEDVQVSIAEVPTLSTAVSGEGRFTLVGVPAGALTLVFQRGGRGIGDIRLTSVRNNQEIRLVVALTEFGEVILIDEDRDHVSFEGECPRGPGFWCQNKDGQNPNLTAEEFQEFAAEAAQMLATVSALDTTEKISAAVCDTGNQLLRHLATLALNLAAGTLTRDTALVNAAFPTVGALFDAAVAAANGSGGNTNAIKDALDRVNDGQSTASCDATPDDDEVPPSPAPSPAPGAQRITICHIPPGNPANRQTITISVSAWPAHQRHGDTLGPCQ